MMFSKHNRTVSAWDTRCQSPFDNRPSAQDISLLEIYSFRIRLLSRAKHRRCAHSQSHSYGRREGIDRKKGHGCPIHCCGDRPSTISNSCFNGLTIQNREVGNKCRPIRRLFHVLRFRKWACVCVPCTLHVSCIVCHMDKYLQKWWKVLNGSSTQLQQSIYFGGWGVDVHVFILGVLWMKNPLPLGSKAISVFPKRKFICRF